MMIRSVFKPLAFAVLAATLSVACLLLAYRAGAALDFEMDRDLPKAIAQGFHPVERAPGLTFAWTTAQATLRLDGLDRRQPWTCELRFRGGRPDPATLPDVGVDVDGIRTANTTATNEFVDLRIDVPGRAQRSGVTLTIVSSNTFRPGGGDTRELGLQVDRLACAPSGFVAPPRDVMFRAAGGGAVFGVVAAVMSVPAVVAAVVLLVMAAGQAVLLSSGPAPYGAYAGTALVAAMWIGACALLLFAVLRLFRRQPLSSAAVTVILVSAVALYLKALGLLHPSKLLIDALFHAHRLQWVLSGRYLFTQGMPGGVSFPYAIGLYVFASPWASLTNDHVSLLRILVSAVEVTAGGLLYVLVARTWRDPLAGVAAVVLYHCVPITFEILGNANMTNVFGQAVALMAVVTCAVWPASGKRIWYWPLAFGITALAFLSHISTFTQLLMTLVALGALFWWRGGEDLRPAGRGIVIVAAAAAVFAVVLYYGHFIDVYRTAWQARAQARVTERAAPPGASAAPAARKEPPPAPPAHQRMGNALRLSGKSIGWPILVIAAAGLWRLIAGGLRDRLSLTVIALGLTYAAFLAASTFSRVDAPFQRYAAEFVGRVVLATFSAAVVLAAVGASWIWRQGPGGRVIATLLAGWALSVGASNWMGWYR